MNNNKVTKSYTRTNKGGLHDNIIYIVAVISSLFHLWVNTIGVMPEIQRNALHYSLILFLGYLIYPINKGSINQIAIKTTDKTALINYTLAVLSVIAGTYLIFFENALHARNEVTTIVDMIFATLAIILLLEITRRTSGIVIPLLSLFVLAYALFLGKHMSGLWNFPGIPLSRVLYRMYFAPDGIFGSIATISSTFVILFVIFASFLLQSGAGEFIIKLAVSLMGKRIGGPAKIAVFASGLMGSISGSAVANTVGTGSITIPLMKKVGFSSKFSAAVEASASTGGQLLPPIMGAGAFIMSQWTQIPYLKIAAVSIIPALMYFLTIIFFIHLRSKKIGIEPISNEDIPKFRIVLKEGWNFIIPITVLIFFLFYGFTPTLSACAGIISVVIASWFNKKTRMGLKDIMDALALGSKNMVATGIILLCAGIVIGIVLLVGMGIKFSMLISTISGNNLLITLLLIALASTILGMGLPVTASYIVLAVLSAPTIVGLMMSDYLINNFGLTLEQARDPNIAQSMITLIPTQISSSATLSAHLLVFWYSQTANVTPPVCLAAYTAAGIAGSNPLKTGFEAWKISAGIYIIPLLFIYTPILFNGNLWLSLESIIAAIIGLLSFAILFEGFHITQLNWSGRMLYGISSLLLLWPYIGTHLAGAGLFIIMMLYQNQQKR